MDAKEIGTISLPAKLARTTVSARPVHQEQSLQKKPIPLEWSSVQILVELAESRVAVPKAILAIPAPC
jgi:hypothetical protein